MARRPYQGGVRGTYQREEMREFIRGMGGPYQGVVIGGLIMGKERIVEEDAFLVVSDFQIRHLMLLNLKLIRDIL